MKNIVKFALLFFFSVLTISCPEKIHRYLYIKNNSSESIYYRFSFAYPDTSLMNSDPNNYKIIPAEQIITSSNGFTFNNTLQLFFLDAKVVETEPWDSIVLHNKILKRYQFTEQLVQTNNWTITYP